MHLFCTHILVGLSKLEYEAHSLTLSDHAEPYPKLSTLTLLLNAPLK